MLLAAGAGPAALVLALSRLAVGGAPHGQAAGARGRAAARLPACRLAARSLLCRRRCGLLRNRPQ